MTELEIIHEYLFERYDKLVVNKKFSSILKQDKTDKRINIIDLIDKYSHGDGFILRDLSSKYKRNSSYVNPLEPIMIGFGSSYEPIPLNISKKEYYNKYIFGDINKIYDQYKRDKFSASSFFIDKLLKAIQEENEDRIIEEKKLEEQYKIEQQKLEKQKNLEEDIVKLQQQLQNITKTKSDNNDKKKKKSIPATIKRLVWNSNIGEQIGKTKCMCCNVTDITQMSFNCGHIIAETNGGKTIVSNLKPICQNCNSSMGTKDMEEFMKTLK